MTVPLGRMMSGPLRRPRRERVVTVFRRIGRLFLWAFRLVSGRSLFASSNESNQTGPFRGITFIRIYKAH